jgi:signal transduction histidine kinase
MPEGISMVNNVPILTTDQTHHPMMISNPWLRILRMVWIILACLSVIVIVISITGYFIQLEARTKLIEPSTISPAWLEILEFGIIAVSVATASLAVVLGWLIFRQNSRARMPVLLSFFLVLYAMAGSLEAVYPFWPFLAEIEFGLIFISLIGPLFVTLFLLFPDGRFVPSWTRWLALLSISVVPVSYFLESSSWSAINQPLFWIGAVTAIGTLILVLYAQIYRFRNVSDPAEKQQTKWVIYGISLWFLVMAIGSVPYAQVQQLPPGSPIPWWQFLNELMYLISFSFLPLSLTIAVLRYRLFDIDIIINRTLVYGILTVTTMGIYVLIVGYMASLFHAIDPTVFAFLATGLVALIFQPLRERLQRGVNRLMFGDRDDPLAVLSSLSKRLEVASEPGSILPSIVETVAQALKLPYVAIEAYRLQKVSVVAEYGILHENVERLPLIHQSEIIGQLVFARRSPYENFSETEYDLLRYIARQTGAAVHAAQLTADLRRSRQQLVTAREEERRRLRRDLHDGLGPSLASLTLKIDAARNKLTSDPLAADRLLVETKEQIQTALGDIRRLVFELRPPALDELGLVKAINAFVDQQNLDTIKVVIASDHVLTDLTAAVEVAAYRIALEGITNVIRHAHASNALVRLYPQNGNLTIEISDDGIGLPEPIPIGVGLTSIRERAEELGGRLVIIPQNPGTLLRTHLPCPKE